MCIFYTMAKLFQKYFSTHLIIKLLKSTEPNKEATYKELGVVVNNIMREEKNVKFYNH